jgi:plastocyanin
MPRSVATGFVVAAAALIVLAVAPLAMMAFMMAGDHGGMMGRGGSDPGREAPAQVTQVSIEDFAFAPANIVVEVGATVTWTNEDSTRHTVTSDDGDVLDSPLFGRGETYSHTFTAPGDYYYHCDPHPQMRGLVTVRERTG